MDPQTARTAAKLYLDRASQNTLMSLEVFYLQNKKLKKKNRQLKQVQQHQVNKKQKQKQITMTKTQD